MAERKMKLPAGEGPGNKKKKIYLALTVILLLLLSITAVVLLHSANERRVTEYVQKARESYEAGDYENALLYLRRVKPGEESTEVLLLMADCYEAMGNYPRAMETLRRLKSTEPAIADRIQALEQRRLQEEQEKRITVAGVEFESTAKSASLDRMGVSDDDLQELTELYALNKLSLRGNRLTDVSALRQLKGLDELDLAENSIREIAPLSELSGLRILNLDGNPIEDCDRLRALRYLSTLSIVNAGIGEAEVYELANALPGCAICFGETGAEKILLAGDVFQMNATELTLSGKELTDIEVLKSFPELKILNLSDNDISDIRPLMELSRLEKLDISHNTVSDLRPLIGLPLLTKLNAEDNLIAETTSVGSCRSLKELNLSGNAIGDFSGLGELTTLSVLDLSSTGISDADLHDLYSLTSLSSLNLTNNTGLSDIAFGALKSALPGCSIAAPELVYEINLSGHLVRSDETRIAFPYGDITDLNGIIKMTHLEEIDLRGNALMSLYPFEVTASRGTIRNLNLSETGITDVLSLYALSGIEELDLSGNRIEVVASLRKLTTLQRLNLSGNPVSEESVNELRGWLPDCEILF